MFFDTRRFVSFVVGLPLVLGVAILLYHLTATEPAVEPEVSIPTATSTAPEVTKGEDDHTTLGHSVEGRAIEVYTFGDGATHLLFVGGMHGGYEWNGILLAWNIIDYFTAHPSAIPSNLTIDIIPNLNPDGLFAATGLEGRFAATDVTNSAMHQNGLGRMNAHAVDLNRNFACNWAPESTWRGKTVPAGSAAFSEPEAQALRGYVANTNLQAVIFWHSMADNVYASECDAGVLPETLTLMNTYATTGGYGAIAKFDAYPITGDAEGWLASLGIPAITVELGSRTSIEWEKNFPAVQAVLQLYGK